MKQIEKAQCPVGDALKHFQRVAPPQPDVAQMLVADMAERGGDAVEKRLGADEAVVGQHVGAVREMLARSEPDFEMQRPILAEQLHGGHLALGGHLDLRQQLLDQLGLALAQFVPARPAIEAVECQRIAGLVRGHWGTPAAIPEFFQTPGLHLPMMFEAENTNQTLIASTATEMATCAR